MFVSEDGYVTGSIDVSRLDEIEPKTDEARAQLEQLKAERDAGQRQADADAERLAKQAEAQSVPGQVRATVTTQGANLVAAAEAQKAADQKAADQKAADQAADKASARRSASSSDKG